MTRSLLDLLETAKVLSRRKVNLVSLRENIDTTTATGRCFLSMMGAIHQMERELRAERAAAGRTSARARGKTGGRPRTDVSKLENARILYENSGKTAAEACAIAGVGRRIFFAHLAAKRKSQLNSPTAIPIQPAGRSDRPKNPGNVGTVVLRAISHGSVWLLFSRMIQFLRNRNPYNSALRNRCVSPRSLWPRISAKRCRRSCFWA
jgi:hypothetical protein